MKSSKRNLRKKLSRAVIGKQEETADTNNEEEETADTGNEEETVDTSNEEEDNQDIFYNPNKVSKGDIFIE